jgi:hypothetical protein
MRNRNHKSGLFTSHTLIRYEIKSSATNSCFQPRFRTSLAKSPPKNRITLEKTTTLNTQEKNTPGFLEEYSTWYFVKIHFLAENNLFHSKSTPPPRKYIPTNLPQSLKRTAMSGGQAFLPVCKIRRTGIPACLQN